MRAAQEKKFQIKTTTKRHFSQAQKINLLHDAVDDQITDLMVDKETMFSIIKMVSDK